MKALALFLASVCCSILATGFAAEAPTSQYEADAHSRLEALVTDQSKVEFLQSLTNLPSSVREKLFDMADKGRPFSSGCVGSDPHRRFLAATKDGTTYNVAFEQGGIIHTWFISQFVVDRSGKVIRESRVQTVDSPGKVQSFPSETNRASSSPGSAP
jgi:hypothetical protein